MVSGLLCREAYVGLEGGYFGIDNLPYYLDFGFDVSVGLKEYIASQSRLSLPRRRPPIT